MSLMTGGLQGTDTDFSGRTGWRDNECALSFMRIELDAGVH